MRRSLAALLFIVLLAPASTFAETKDLRVYHASFLRIGPNAAKVTPEERARLFAQHLAYRHALYEAGELLMYGPVEESPDQTLRGVSIFRGDKSTDEIRKLVAEDPYVKAGVMTAEVTVWLSVVPKLNRGFATRRIEVEE